MVAAILGASLPCSRSKDSGGRGIWMPGAGAGVFESPFNLEKSAHVCPVDGEAPALH